MHKPQLGACGVCGSAVVHPTAAEVVTALAQDQWPNGRGRAWVSGHLYERIDPQEKPRLRRVRCERHVERDDPRHPDMQFFD